MKKIDRMLMILLFCCLCGSHAQAMENNMLKVGIKYGGDAMFAANLQNYDGAGWGYEFGYYDTSRAFVPLGVSWDGNKITMIADGNVYISGGAYYQDAPVSYTQYIGAYHLRLTQQFASGDEAAAAASAYEGGFVAWLGDRYEVYVGQYRTPEGVERALSEWTGPEAAAVSPSRTGVMVVSTGTDRILFFFDCGGLRSLGVRPKSVNGEKTVTWFRGYRYYGGFEYQRVTGGSMSVINVVNVEDYVKGCVPWEIGNDKPLEAIKAQAVCARTYAAMQTRHRSQGFDVCTTDDCQVYQGVAFSNEVTDRAVDETAGVYLYYNGKYVEAYYHSSDGGATEDAENVWNNAVGYLKGREDPYEASVASRISNYNWSTTFTAAELTAKLKAKGIDIGTVNRVYVSQYTTNGNVYALTFEGTSGSRTVYRETCRTLLGLRSMRFHVDGGSGDTGGAKYYINGSGNFVTGWSNIFTVAGSGTISALRGTEVWTITSGGKSKLAAAGTTAAAGGTFTFSGSGWGHNVGMSQWGAVAMAEQGFSFREILQFYYTGVTIQ